MSEDIVREVVGSVAVWLLIIALIFLGCAM